MIITYAFTLVDPVTIVNTDKDGRVTDTITSHRSTGSGALSPTDTFNQSDWQTWTSTQYSIQHQKISSRLYFAIPASGIGTSGTNFAETDFGFDALERQNRLLTPGGTITRTVWTTPQWVASIWVGTNDIGATDSDPTGGGAAGNNMVMVTSNIYDGGSAGGNGNLTSLTQYVSGTSGDTRNTSFGYDFRNRKISMTGEVNTYQTYTLDNLGNAILTQNFNGTSGNLISQAGANFDARGRQYQTLIFAVNITTGAVGNVLTGNTWFDPSGNTVQSIAPGAGRVFSKTAFNGVNWITATYTGFNACGTSYCQAQTPAGDVIVEQSDLIYDEAGNQILTISSQRLNDATGVGQLCACQQPAVSAPNQPAARVSSVATWFDGVNREVFTANYGTGTRAALPPGATGGALVNATAYDAAGRAFQTTDPKGIVNQTGFDNANRRIQTIEDVGGLARTTNFTYTLDGLIATMTAVNAVTGDQTTTWGYGTTLTSSGVARNDLLVNVTYPDFDYPIGYLAGISLYAAFRTSPVRMRDPFGTDTSSTQPGSLPTSNRALGDLIAQLGDDDPSIREQAERELLLKLLGDENAQELEKELKDELGGDPEVNARIREILNAKKNISQDRCFSRIRKDLEAIEAIERKHPLGIPPDDPDLTLVKDLDDDIDTIEDQIRGQLPHGTNISDVEPLVGIGLVGRQLGKRIAKQLGGQ